MKLELKHLLAYVSYGIKIQWIDNADLFGITFYESIDYNNNLYPLSTLEYTLKKGTDLGWKLVLRPLSDLINEASLFHIWENETDLQSMEDLINMDAESFFSSKFSYLFWELIFQNHFDCFGLIDAGFAVNYNDI